MAISIKSSNSAYPPTFPQSVSLNHTHSHYPYQLTNSSISNNLSADMVVNGTLECKEITIDGVKLSDTLREITRRLSILQPKPEHLEKHVILADLYEQYQVALALLYGGEE